MQKCSINLTARYHFGLKVDLIDWGVPLLISRHSLGLMQDRIDFVANDIIILKEQRYRRNCHLEDIVG